jgi:hypothetical protein
MANLLDYIQLSEPALGVKEIYTLPQEFSDNYKSIFETERVSFLRHYIINNKPFAFDEKPLLFEQIAKYLSDSIKVPVADIRLIGSAKTGFTISSKEYGKKYSNKGRDLDFSIINEDLFFSLKDEFESWLSDFKMNVLLPNNPTEAFYWKDNSINVPTQLARGFIDSYKIPNYPDFPNARKINNCMSLIVLHLNALYSIEAKGASSRVYKNWNTFINQVKLNTETVLGIV